MKRKDKLIVLLLGLFVAGILSLDFLDRQFVPARDSGTFLYIGQQMLQGAVPYSDVWDHKPPLIFFINALALLLSRDSIWGIYLFEFLSIYAAAITGYILMKKNFGFLPGLFSSLIWIFSLTPLTNGGNYPEEYLLPIEFFSLYIFWKSETSSYQTWRIIALGIAFGLTLLLKPNLISLYVSIIIYFILKALFNKKERKEQPRNIGLLLISSIGVVSVLLLYLFLNDDFYEFYNNVIIYNSIYVTKSISAQFRSILAGFIFIPGFIFLACISWVSVLCRFFPTRFKNINPLVKVSFISFPILIFSATLSGKDLTHYYIVYLPIFSILIASCIETFVIKIKNIRAASSKKSVFGIALFPSLAYVITFMITVQIANTISEAKDAEEDNLIRKNAIEYIKKSTSQDDYVLMWGAESVVNFMSVRKSPSRYAYQYALFTNGYQNDKTASEFLADIKKNQPLIIIDASVSDRNVPSFNSVKRRNWQPEYNRYGISPSTNRVFQYINTHYKKVRVIDKKWDVYKRVKQE